MPFTVIELCNAALDDAQLDQSSSFQTLAKRYLKFILEDLPKKYDWPVYRIKSANTNLIGGTLSYNLPADFVRSDTCYLYSNGQKSNEILILEQSEFDRLSSNPNSGVPSIAYIDSKQKKIVFDMSPNGGGYSYSITYFGSDISIDVSGTTTDTSVPTFDDQMFLLKELTGMLMNYQDDERVRAQKQEAAQTLAAGKYNIIENNTSPGVELSHRFFRAGRRPTRGGGWGAFE
jgi:hypothetical protein